jgi:hypothetical protein
MKKPLLFLYSTFCIAWATPSHSTFAQSDSIRITHTQETGTLEKQRFIDQYDYVFMTKEPTKWMLKAYGNDYGFLFNKLTFKNLLTAPFGAIEHKLSPSFSIQLEGRFQQNIYSPIFNPDFDALGQKYTEAKGLSLQLTGEIRWYYAMAKRIKEGKSANNFSGNYFSLRYGELLANQNRQLTIPNGFLMSQNGAYLTNYLYATPKNEFNLAYGIQRRFFRFGLIDMSINLSHKTQNIIQQKIIFPNDDNRVIANSPPQYDLLQSDYQPFGNKSSWQIFTKVQFGMALADLKKKSNFSKCDIFRCYENQSRMAKIAWPIMYLSPTYQRLSGALGFEQKLFSSPISFNSYLNYNLFNEVNKDTWLYSSSKQSFTRGASRYYYLNYALNLQGRYYFLLANRIKKGKSGNHLSGFYTGINALASGSKNFYESDFLVEGQTQSKHGFSVGLLAGFQQKLFKNGFIDAYYSFYARNASNQIVYPFSNIKSLTIQLGFAL